MEFLCEHVVQRKRTGLYRFAYVGIIFLWIVIPLVIISVSFALSSLGPKFEVFKWSVFLIPLFLFVGMKIGPITVAYAFISYEYSVLSSEIEFSKIYGDRFRKSWFKADIKTMDKVAPYEGLYKSEADNSSYDRIYKAVSSMDAPHVYYAVFADERKKKLYSFF